MAVSGLGVAYAATGFVLLWSGVKNATLKDTLTSFLKGQQPAADPTGALTVGVADTTSATASAASGSSSSSSSSVAATGGTVSGVSEKANQAVAMAAAAVYGWTGSQWTALNNVEMAEAGWNNLAQNPSSGAFGIAQALGHGTSGTAGKYGNNYGGYGLTTSQAIAANNGSAGPQIQWMLAYVKSRWGSPEAAWANEQSEHWY